MAKAIDLAALAAKYGGGRKYPCVVCDLEPERKKAVTDLRAHPHSFSYRSLANLIAKEYGKKLCEGTVRRHFLNHEQAA